jgi:hypothetical protein
MAQDPETDAIRTELALSKQKTKLLRDAYKTQQQQKE